jgi:type II secretory pathway component PulJ
MNNTHKQERGSTLVELLISMSLFVILVSVAMGGFIQTLSNQRLVLKLMASTDNMSLTLEQIMREVRVSTEFEPESGQSSVVQFKRFEETFGGSAEFLIAYEYDENQGAIFRTKTRLDAGGSPIPGQEVRERITANDVEVTNFSVIAFRSAPGAPVRLTILVGISATDKGRTVTNNIQTTVSSRLF